VILRGAVLSEKRIALEPTRLERPVAPRPLREAGAPAAVGTLAVAGTVAAAGTAVVAGTAALEASPERPPIALVPPPISLEAVLAWLSTRDEATRRALAAHLDPEIEDLRHVARKEGFAAGQAQGLSESRAQLQSVYDSLEVLVGSAGAAFEREAETLAGQCTDVVCEVLAKIAGPLLSTREAALGAVLGVIRRLQDGREIVIRVNAADLPMLQAAEPALAEVLGGRKFSIVADGNLLAGGCIVDSTLGSLDARFDIQLAAALETLRAARPRTEDPQ
jgi:flagellar assembly protein FliH